MKNGNIGLKPKEGKTGESAGIGMMTMINPLKEPAALVFSLLVLALRDAPGAFHFTKSPDAIAISRGLNISKPILLFLHLKRYWQNHLCFYILSLHCTRGPFWHI